MRTGNEYGMRFESLEARNLLAGDVLAEMVGTTLHLRGDDLSNQIEISQVASNIVVAGDDTRVHIDGDLSRTTGIVLQLGGGDDHVIVNDVELSRDIMVNTATNGSTDLSFESSTIRDLNVRGSAANIVIAANDTSFRRLIAANQSNGVFVALDSSNVVRDVFVTASNGATSRIEVIGESRLGRLRQTTIGGGDSTTLITDDSVVESFVRVQNREGRSDVRITENAEIGRYIGSGFTSQRNVEYANVDGKRLNADIYTPRSLGPHPAVILVHGGGWRAGNKSNMASQARELADRGYVAVTIDYRLAPANPYPAQVEDVDAAIGWVQANASTYDIDTEHIGLYGFSAGAHLTLLAGMRDSTSADAVQAVVAGGAGVDFRNVESESNQYVHLFGGTRDELPGLYEDASPSAWISPDDPAIYLFVGERDELINRENLDAFYASAASAGNDIEFYTSPRKSHLGSVADRLTRLYSYRFFDEQLK